MPFAATLAERTELEVESGSAAFADCMRSLLMAIQVIEQRHSYLALPQLDSARSALDSALWHYGNVMEIDPERGSSNDGQAAIAQQDHTSLLKRWHAERLMPDLGRDLEVLFEAARSGKPSALLNVFIGLLQDCRAALDETLAAGERSREELVTAVWRATAQTARALLVGQAVALINRAAADAVNALEQTAGPASSQK